MRKIIFSLIAGGIIGGLIAHGNFPGSWELGYYSGYSISQSKIAYERWIERHPDESGRE
jgi:hypothetical protein